jgi:hypothetical protein
VLNIGLALVNLTKQLADKTEAVKTTFKNLKFNRHP